MKILAQFLYNFGLGLDQFVNVLLLGDPDESLSGRLGRAHVSGRAKWWCEPMRRALDAFVFLAFGETDHCVNAIEPEESDSKELWSWINR